MAGDTFQATALRQATLGMRVELDVRGGPERGKRMRSFAPVITIGRGPKNDLVLRDGLVSQYHGELVLRPKGYIYRDLRSRHGTLVRLDRITINLHNRGKTQEVSLPKGAQLMMGESVIEVRVDGRPPDAHSIVDEPAQTPTLGGPFANERLRDEHIVTRSQDSLEAVTRRLSGQDPRLGSIFRLSRQLNAASDLDRILALIVAATFEAFPAANFFAITPVDESPDGVVVNSIPLLARDRRTDGSGEVSPLLSHSLLEQVASTRESVLFVRDESGQPVSQSIIKARIMSCLAAPLIGQRRLIGVMQADTRGRGQLFGPDDLDLFTVVASYAAFAIERVRLNDSIVQMFDGFVSAAVSAVDARDPSTAGHSERVAAYTVELAQSVCEVSSGPLATARFTDAELTELRYAALLHDLGKIGVKEAVLTKAERLYPGDQATIAERFEAIKSKRAYDVQRRYLDALRERGEAPDSAQLATIDREIANIGDEIDRLRELILNAQQVDPHSAETVERLIQVGKRRWTDLMGVERPYLTVRELEHLCVPTGTLTEVEWAHMKAHAAMSRDLLDQIPWSDELSNIPCIVGSHHEKLDGSGYPDGIAGDAIPMAVRVLTVCDIYDALTAADRPYRRAMTVERALEIIQGEAERGLLDRDLVELFQHVIHAPQTDRSIA